MFTLTDANSTFDISNIPHDCMENDSTGERWVDYGVFFNTMTIPYSSLKTIFSYSEILNITNTLTNGMWVDEDGDYTEFGDDESPSDSDLNDLTFRCELGHWLNEDDNSIEVAETLNDDEWNQFHSDVLNIPVETFKRIYNLDGVDVCGWE